jgi:hypothetical protein
VANWVFGHFLRPIGDNDESSAAISFVPVDRHVSSVTVNAAPLDASPCPCAASLMMCFPVVKNGGFPLFKKRKLWQAEYLHDNVGKLPSLVSSVTRVPATRTTPSASV